MAHKRLLANITYLGLVQVTNYLVPLIAIPILLDRIGLGKYGIISLAFNICNIFVTLTDYGYNLTGTREVSQNRSNPSVLQRILSQILQVRLFLLVAGFFILLLLTWSIPSWRSESFVILSTYVLVIAQGLFPIWYFQGIEKMEFLTLINFGARLLYLAGILFFIQSTDDYIYVNIINGIAWMITSGAGLIIVIKRLELPRFTPSIQTIRDGLRDNFPIFLSKITTAGHRNSALIIGGFFLPAHLLGLFAIFDKIMAAMILFGSVVFRAFFARVSEITEGGFEHIQKFFRKFLKIALAPTLLASLALAFSGPALLALVTDIEVTDSFAVFFYLIALLPLLLVLNIPLSLTLIAFNRRRHFFYYNFSGMVTMLILGSIGVYFLQVSGLILATLIAELSMIAVGYWKLKGELI